MQFICVTRSQPTLSASILCVGQLRKKVESWRLFADGLGTRSGLFETKFHDLQTHQTQALAQALHRSTQSDGEEAAGQSGAGGFAACEREGSDGVSRPNPISELRNLVKEAAAEAYVETSSNCWPWSHRWTMWEQEVQYSMFQYRHCVKCGLTKSKFR